ncbi:hypothetical protein F2Q70_00011628 [Brassica cretica]|uniref:Uncharacterized protein n=1 Tax=Brassica cretica TaxID=69181 RepID=A0A8S9M130_BRACR|nr:hypothetical protein F2Q70_00011628 [Brassica cretica]
MKVDLGSCAEGFSARLEQPAPAVPASVGQRLEQHPAELGWSAASAAFGVASSATQQRVHSDGQGLP